LNYGVKYRIKVRALCDGCSDKALSGKKSNFTAFYEWIQPNARLEDGSEISSETETISEPPIVYPNPNNGSFNLSYQSNESGSAYMGLLDITGRLVWSQNYAIQEGNNVFTLNDLGLSSGMYILNWVTPKGKQTVKVVVE